MYHLVHVCPVSLLLRDVLAPRERDLRPPGLVRGELGEVGGSGVKDALLSE
jgi:hypothetical protein